MLLVQSLRHLHGIRLRGKPVGRSLVALLLLIQVLSVAVSCHPYLHSAPWAVIHERTALETRLREEPGSHVVVVDIKPSRRYYPYFSWVYNLSDIDSARVVWAWDLGVERNEQLCLYYANRRIWRLRVGSGPVRLSNLTPYSRP
jgi:hypothetical protein